MSEIYYKHVCEIADGGCGREYSSLEIDKYFCKDCVQARKGLYAQIDKKVQATARPRVKSDYELFMEKGKTVSHKLPDGTEIITTRMQV